jgi:hypothetical protein
MRRAWSKPIRRVYPKPTCVLSDVDDNTCGQQLAANTHLKPVRESEEIWDTGSRKWILARAAVRRDAHDGHVRSNWRFVLSSALATAAAS